MGHLRDLSCLRVVFSSLDGFPSDMPGYIFLKNMYERHGYRTPERDPLKGVFDISGARLKIKF